MDMKMSVRMWAHAQAGLEQAATVMATVAAAERVALGLLWPHVRVYFQTALAVDCQGCAARAKELLAEGMSVHRQVAGNADCDCKC